MRSSTLPLLGGNKLVGAGGSKRCRLSWAWLTSSALVYEPKCVGGGTCGVSANEYSCTQEPK